jgi:integrase
MIGRLALAGDTGVEKPASHSLPELLELWKNSKIAEGLLNDDRLKDLCHRQKVMLDFFREHGLNTTDDFAVKTADDFKLWRSKKRYDNSKAITSASAIKKELDVLRQLAKLAALYGWIGNGGLWDNARVKAIVGKNKKVVEPLSIEEQKEMLCNLRSRNEACHDIALFMLITGMRRGELKMIKPDCIRNGVISLHGDYVGNYKTTGKTSSASRNIPVCPTMEKLFERGLIFSSSTNALSLVFARYFKGLHLHRLRHTFAVNKLLAKNDLQMVSYQMGHATTGITADLYGKFVPEHFKAGFEQATAERKELLKWLETDYFNCGGQNV